MSQPREPVRWIDPTSDSDPVLRRLLQNARADLGDPRLAERIEQAVQIGTAADSGDEAHPLATKPSARTWRPWIGVATLLLGLTGTMLATQRRIPAASSSNPAPTSTSSEAPPAASSVTTLATRDITTLTSDANRQQHPHASLAAEGGNANASSAAVPARRSSTSLGRSQTALSSSLAATSVEPSSTAASEARHARSISKSTTAAVSGTRSNTAATATPSEARANVDATVSTSDTRSGMEATTAPTRDGHSNTAATAPASDAPGAAAPAKHAIPPELNLISAAQRALRTAPAEALSLTAQHASAYPNGRFSEEREEIAISALWALGDLSAARTRAQTFLSQHPRALSAPRIKHLLDAAR